MFQMGGIGPMFGQWNHFAHYAPEEIPYALERYGREVRRLYGVLDRQLARTGGFVASGEFTIADMAVYPWAKGWERQEQSLDDKPHMARWLDACAGRPGVERGMAVGAEARSPGPMSREEQEVLFGRR